MHPKTIAEVTSVVLGTVATIEMLSRASTDSSALGDNGGLAVGLDGSFISTIDPSYQSIADSHGGQSGTSHFPGGSIQAENQSSDQVDRNEQRRLGQAEGKEKVEDKAEKAEK